MILYTRIPSPLGIITLASKGSSLIGLWLEGQKYHPDFSQWEYAPQYPVFIETAHWLGQYFAGLRPDPRALPLAPEGTEFQKLVWLHLLEIPYGEHITYGDLAKKLNCGSPRAVGAAVSRNPISIVIPCHRVLGQGGQLTGYAGGLVRKRWILEFECIQ